MKGEKVFLTYKTATTKFLDKVDNIARKINVLGKDAKIITFVGAENESGATVFANCFAEFESVSKKTLIIDADSVSTSLAKHYKTEAGLGEVLEGKCTMAKAVIKSEGLDVLGFGTCERRTIMKFDELFIAFLEGIKADYDRIVIDAPSFKECTTAMAISKFSDGVVVMIKAGTKMATAQQTFENLALANANVIGAVLNRL